MSSYYEASGEGEVALVFVHGWMGNARWWDAARDAFATSHRVVAMDLGGHGRSAPRETPTAEAYAEDIVGVVRAAAGARVVLVGHSMAGAYATLAAPEIAGLERLVLVDTLKNLDAIPTAAQVAPMLAAYRADYATALREALPKFLFGEGTPRAVIERLTAEFGAVDGDTAAKLLAPLYDMDVRAAARRVRVPVRGIATELSPTSIEANRKYFADYDEVIMRGALGHYPMLEAPEAFAEALRTVLA